MTKKYPIVKAAEITRAGFEYQDLVGIEILLKYFREPDLYKSVELEAEDKNTRALDDVIAVRKDGSIEYTQVKFTSNPEKYTIDWDWLLKKKGAEKSLLSKWSTSYFNAIARGVVSRAELKTNRIPSLDFSACLVGDRVDLERLPEEMRKAVVAECGGEDRAIQFFRQFVFSASQLDFDRYEMALRDQVVPTDTDMAGWLLLRNTVTRWAMFRAEPPPDGKIVREHLVQIITRRRPQPLRQDFFVPEGYSPPSEAFDTSFRKQIAGDGNPVTILWGTPGKGKSTYLSYITKKLQDEDQVVLRHHYFLSSEDTSTNRMSFFDIAHSLIDQLFSRYPETSAGVNGDPDKLREGLATAAQNLASKGKRLYLLIDGLDHVWRDTFRTDQLNHLFNVIFPLPENVSVIVGTQRVPDAQLPSKLLITAEDDDWAEIPSMDESSVHRWVRFQYEARPLLLKDWAMQKAEPINAIAGALFDVSQGHPLYLIYAYESLLRTGRPIDEDEIHALPPCPDGDIRTYYKGLWVRLTAPAKNILHMLAGSEFFWPSLGIRQCIGDYGEIDYLLEPRNSGLVPFHTSIFAYVRERSDHEECYTALLPQIVLWLEDQAPDYWRWGWLWLIKARAGDYSPLIQGATRDWVVESFARGWPEQQIVNILSAAESKTFEDGDLATTIRLRSLKTRVSNAREFQSYDYGLFRAVALSVHDNRQQVRNFIDEIHNLTEDEIVTLAKYGPSTIHEETVAVCLAEIARRVNTWIALRHKPQHDFTKLSDQLLAVAALSGKTNVQRTLRFLKGYRKPEEHIQHYIQLLGEALQVEAIEEVRKALRGRKWTSLRRTAQDHALRASLILGADPATNLSSRWQEFTPFIASWLLWSKKANRVLFYIPPAPEELLSEQNSLTGNPPVSAYFYDFFWTVLATNLQATGEFSVIYPSHDQEKMGWLESALECLEWAARRFASKELKMSFSAIYEAANNLERMDHLGPNDRTDTQYRAFRQSLLRIALDLHLLDAVEREQIQIQVDEFRKARKSQHWVDDIWIEKNIALRTTILDSSAANNIISDAVAKLSKTITEFNERSGNWTQYAMLSYLYGVQSPAELIYRAADCLVGYGWRKDLSALEVLDAIENVHLVDTCHTNQWVRTIAPAIDQITDFTDGDETDHVRSQLIDTTAVVAPLWLANLYEHHIAADEWRYADETLEASLGVLDMSEKATTALAGSLLDSRML